MLNNSDQFTVCAHGDRNFHCIFFSTFISNDGGRGGAVSTANVPLSFSGFNVFKANRGRSVVVSVCFL